MTDVRPNAVIDGTYSDFKIVKTRSVFQIVIEGPIEKAADAIAMFGVPLPGQEIHVAVARLQTPANPAPAPAGAPPLSGVRTASVEGTPDAVPGRGHRVSEVPALGDSFPPNAAVVAATAEGPGHKSEISRERYRMMDEGERAVVRAAMLAKDARFGAWLKDAVGTVNHDPAQFIRDWCRVKSRSEIASNAQAFERFHDLEFQIAGHAEQRG